MRRYRVKMAVAAAAAVMVVLASGCSKKQADVPAESKPGDVAQSVERTTKAPAETAEAEIRIDGETAAPENGAAQAAESKAAAESQAAAESKAAEESKAAAEAAKAAAESKAAETQKAKEKEPPKTYSVKAYEDTMYATSSVNVRASYTTQSEVLTSLSPGQRVNVTGRSENGWIRVIYNGRDGYVYQKYLSQDPPSKKKETASKPKETEASGTAAPRPIAPDPGVTVYPGGSEEPTGNPGQIPIVEPAPAVGSGGGDTVSEYGPGVSPSGGGSRPQSPVTGGGPGVS